MALVATVLTDAVIIINSNTLSDHGNQVELSVTATDLDTTAFGQTWVNRVGGLKDAQLAITFLNDFQATNLDSIIWPLLDTVVSFEVKPTSAARSTANPSYIGSVLISDWKPISGKVGELATTSVTWKTSGAVTRTTQ